MERRETYATTGPRMIVRFFGGWDFEDKDARTRMPAVVGYAKGVPMGGDLRDAPAGKSPTFLVAALKDPIGANLDRIQIIKGWLDKDGRAAREDLRRGLGRRPQARPEDRQAAPGRQHRGRGGGHLDEHHRRAGADHGLEGSGVRSVVAGVLLRPRHRDPDAALDVLTMPSALASSWIPKSRWLPSSAPIRRRSGTPLRSSVGRGPLLSFNQKSSAGRSTARLCSCRNRT